MRSTPGFRELKPLRWVASLLCLILLATAAQAYTVVLRSGRTVEIPGAFTINDNALIYEAAPGIQVSLQIATVNIAATERLNGEKPGSFLTRTQRAPEPGVEAKQSQAGRRTVTNRDLEPFARSRKESELAYERRRKELGLPSLEESRQKAAAESFAMRERLEESQAELRANETYWRERAITLKSEIAATDAEINSLRQQLDWLPSPNSLASVTVASGVAPFLPLIPFGNAVISPNLTAPVVRGGVFVSPNHGPQINGRINGGPRFFPRQRFRRVRSSPFPIFPAIESFGYQPFDFGYDRTVLMSRLNERIAQRAALQARWRVLEDEARMAGALPGWLRP